MKGRGQTLVSRTMHLQNFHFQTQNLIGNDYTWSSSVFYFGFLAFSYPASFLMVRLPLGKYLAVTWCVQLPLLLPPLSTSCDA